MDYSKKQVILMCKDVPDNFKLVASKTNFISDCDENESYDIEAYKNNELIFKDNVAYTDIWRLQCGKGFSNQNAKFDYQRCFGSNNGHPKTDFCGVIYNENIKVTKAYSDNNLDYTEYNKFRDELIEYILYKDYKKGTVYKD